MWDIDFTALGWVLGFPIALVIALIVNQKEDV